MNTSEHFHEFLNGILAKAGDDQAMLMVVQEKLVTSLVELSTIGSANDGLAARRKHVEDVCQALTVQLEDMLDTEEHGIEEDNEQAPTEGTTGKAKRKKQRPAYGQSPDKYS